ncbi:glycosyltransferase [Conexibacter sp. W3-3-2]|uniref:glycosyltransferase n=1 Tax=Conexibacter sp. W3-3-2 TaxID=2675227 RepID=UPI0012B923E9|nr:glycosyltransferase [Conexibacter sp. W3-3-2]MTD43105.1 glycosyltransferase [Conexibacter sp. W3-3-2]
MTTSSSASPADPPVLGVLLDVHPLRSQTFVTTELRELAALGHRIHVEATRRGDHEPEPIPGVTVRWRQDDVAVSRGSALPLLVGRPRATVADRVARQRWRRGEAVPPLRELLEPLARLQAAGVEHLHAHFAAGAALDALRLARLLRVPWSVTAHAYDIYQRPENLAEKLRDAAFSTSGCDYTVADLRRIAGPGHADRVHRIVMGVDAATFRRTRPLPGGRRVVAVGRLVEKKGFAHLLEAAAILERQGQGLEQLVIVGDGPLRAALEARAAELLPTGRYRFLGAQDAATVRGVLDRADLLAMPCVVAADGDRDSMPVVVKEALAMELLVVASDEVGLPEIVRPPAGTLVAPGDPAALAQGLAAALALGPDARAAAGAAGRELVLREADAAAEAAKLSQLVLDAR